MVSIGKFQIVNWKLYSQICNQVAQKGSEGSCFRIFSTSFWLNDGWCTSVSYQIQTHIIDVIHVLVRKEVTCLKLGALETKCKQVQLGNTPFVTK